MGSVTVVNTLLNSYIIRIMKKFRQQFKTAIITTSDGFTQIICQSSHQSRNRPKLAGHTKGARQPGHRKQYGVL